MRVHEHRLHRAAQVVPDHREQLLLELLQPALLELGEPLLGEVEPLREPDPAERLREQLDDRLERAPLVEREPARPLEAERERAEPAPGPPHRREEPHALGRAERLGESAARSNASSPQSQQASRPRETSAIGPARSDDATCGSNPSASTAASAPVWGSAAANSAASAPNSSRTRPEKTRATSRTRTVWDSIPTSS